MWYLSSIGFLRILILDILVNAFLKFKIMNKTLSDGATTRTPLGSVQSVFTVIPYIRNSCAKIVYGTKAFFEKKKSHIYMSGLTLTLPYHSKETLKFEYDISGFTENINDTDFFFLFVQQTTKNAKCLLQTSFCIQIERAVGQRKTHA